tara:strand:- start:32 stop:154 length:123 start_codon:yes stop_codon:yes gene_type:complete
MDPILKEAFILVSIRKFSWARRLVRKCINIKKYVLKKFKN